MSLQRHQSTNHVAGRHARTAAPRCLSRRGLITARSGPQAPDAVTRVVAWAVDGWCGYQHQRALSSRRPAGPGSSHVYRAEHPADHACGPDGRRLLGHALPAAGRAVHGPARCHDRQRRPAHHRPVPARVRGRPATGGGRVHHQLRHPADHRSPAGGHLRPAANVPDRGAHVHRRLAGLRAGPDVRVPDRRPVGPGGRARRR